MKINSLYIAPLQKDTGSLLLSIGIMNTLKANFSKVAFFKPIIKTADDHNINFILEYFNLEQKYEQSYGFTIDEVEKLLSENNSHELFEILISKFQKLSKKYDFILMEGLSSDDIAYLSENDINLSICKNLNTSIIPILSGENKDESFILEHIKIEENNIKKESIDHFATIVNKVDTKVIKALKKKDKSDDNRYYLPYIKELSMPTMYEVKKALDSEILFGDKKHLNQNIEATKIASMGFDNFIKHIKNQTLIVVSGDRTDILLGSLAAIQSKTTPHIAGIILTGDLKPKKPIANLINGFKDLGIAVLSSKYDTYETSVIVSNIKPTISPKSCAKVAIMLGQFEKYIDKNKITEKLNIQKSDIITPIMFEYNLFEKAKEKKRHIVLPESEDDRILRASEILLHREVVDITLLGNKDEILHRASLLGLNLENANIIDPLNEESMLEDFANTYYELRKHKRKLILNEAKDLMMTDKNYFGTMMVHKGLADGMVSGAVGTTANTVLPPLQIIKTQKNIDIVSSIFFMCLDTKVLVYGDCAINQSPNAQQLAQIALSSAMSAKAFGIEPKIAMLSYSTGTSGSGADVDLVIEATNIVKQKDPSLLVEGPIQYDAAIEKSVANKKLPGSKVAGEATVFIFPDLNTGNNTYKAVQRSSGAIAIGPVLQGLNKPVNDLSRGCLVSDIVNTVAITAIQVEEN